jgi:hypothetical protein
MRVFRRLVCACTACLCLRLPPPASPPAFLVSRFCFFGQRRFLNFLLLASSRQRSAAAAARSRPQKHFPLALVSSAAAALFTSCFFFFFFLVRVVDEVEEQLRRGGAFEEWGMVGCRFALRAAGICGTGSSAPFPRQPGLAVYLL